MSRVQQWIAGTVVVVLAIVAAGWFALIAPQKHKASGYVSQAVQAEQANDGLRGKVTLLKSQLSAVPSEQAVVADAAQRIPADPELPNYVRSLTTAAKTAGVDLISIAPGPPAPISAVVAAVVAAPSATSTASASATPAVPAAPAVSLQSISVTLGITGGYFQIQQYVAALEKLNRSTVLTNITLAPKAPLSASLTGESAAPSAAPSSTAWQSLGASITLDVFMNSAAPFSVPAAPAVTPSPSAIASH